MKTFTPRSLAKVISMIILLFVSRNASASHAQSADLTYTCIGQNQYQIRLSFYRDCAGIAAPNSVSIDINSASCNQSFSATLSPVPGTGIDVTPICPTVTTNCNGGTYPGVQEWVYTGIITLPAQCNDWVFSFNLCCRNNAISTINNPGGENIYVEAHLNNLDYPCNNSPQFSNKPVPFICVNQTYCFNHGATDPDGDSLVYQLVPPATSPTTTVTYLSGYSATQPMMSNPPVTVNTVTGDICMTPTMLEVTVMAVKVSEYRNGEFIGSVIRDIQVRVINCTNSNPYLSGINNTSNFSIGGCAGNTIQFDIYSNDPDAGQNLTVNWNNAIPGATFTTGSGAHPTSTFTWTPTTAQINSNPYCFTVTVSDDNCPLNGTQTYSYCITVSGFTVNTSTTAANCGASNGTASVNASGGNSPYQYLWSTGNSNSNINGLQAGNYSVSVTDASGCTMTDTASVAQGSAPGNINMSSTPVSCYGGNNGAVTANVNGGQQPYSYLWNTGATTPSLTGVPAGNYSLTVTTANGCITTANVQVTQPSSPLSTNTTYNNVSCNGINDGNAQTTPAGGTPPYSYSWNTSPAQNSSAISNLSAGSYQVIIQDGEGCTITDHITITEPSPIIISELNNTPVNCFGGNNGSVTVNANGGTGNFQYNWNTSPSQNNNQATGLSAGNYTVTVTDANSCSQTYSTTINEPTQLTAAISNIVNVNCFGNQNGAATVGAIGGTAPYTYHWNTIPQQYTATANTLSGGNYIATVTDAHGCTATATAPVSEPALLQLTTTGSDTICPGNVVTITATANGGISPYTYNWNNGLSNSPTQTVSPANTTSYTVSVVDANGCPASAQNINVTVNDIAQVYFTVGATSQICVGQSATVVAEVTGGIGNYMINWSNGLPSTVGPFTVYPDSSGYYTATITDVCGNQRTESAYVTVLPLPEVQLTPQNLTDCGSVTGTFNNVQPNNTGNTYHWDFGDGQTSNQEVANHIYQQSGNYHVTLVVTSAQGCINADSTTCVINVKTQAVANFAMDHREVSIFDPTVRFYNQSSNYSISEWTFGDGNTSTQNNPVNEYANVGTYTVTLVVNNNNNCPDTTSDMVYVNPEFTFYVPNAFTPDGDGKNDLFFGKGENVDEFEMLIFNRWGENIFTTQNVTQGWDGTFRGENAKPDVYVYKIKIKDSVKGAYHFLEGHVTLIR